MHSDFCTLNDWVLSGAGMEGESYTSESHPELIMKVDTVGRLEAYEFGCSSSAGSTELSAVGGHSVGSEHSLAGGGRSVDERLQREYAQTAALLRLGISVPKVLEITRFNGHPALIFQRIQNKKSFCRLAGERPDLIPALAKRMAAIVRDLHSKSAAEIGGGAVSDSRGNHVVDLQCGSVEGVPVSAASELHSSHGCSLSDIHSNFVPDYHCSPASEHNSNHCSDHQGNSDHDSFVSQDDDYCFTSVLDEYQTLLNGNTVLDAATKMEVQNALDAIAAEDRATILHGDMHFGNIITDGDNDYLIDLGDVCYGHPNNDLAMFYIATHYGSDHSFDFLYHLTWRQALDFWDIFKVAYYGKEISDAEVLAQLRNYMLARSVWFKDPQIQTGLCNILCREDIPLSSEIKLKALGE